jgi:hypothetical protein
MAITKSFIGPKKGSHPEIPATGLHFIKETDGCRGDTYHTAGYARATETAKSLEIKNFKVEQGWCKRFI